MIELGFEINGKNIFLRYIGEDYKNQKLVLEKADKINHLNNQEKPRKHK